VIAHALGVKPILLMVGNAVFLAGLALLAMRFRVAA